MASLGSDKVQTVLAVLQSVYIPNKQVFTQKIFF
jgi:hypothetical protein